MHEASDVSIHRPDPQAPTKRWEKEPIAVSETVPIHDRRPEVAQPFKFAGGSTINDFVVGSNYWMLGKIEGDGRRAWRVTLRKAHPAGKDVMLEFDILAG